MKKKFNVPKGWKIENVVLGGVTIKAPRGYQLYTERLRAGKVLVCVVRK